MKLRQLRIDGFGKFNNKIVDIDPQNQLIFGDNEAGKSSVYQFIRTILFGFPKKREMLRDFTPINGALYGGKLIFDDAVHGKVVVERYKEKNKGQASVRLENGEVGNETLLEQLLAPLTKETFDQIFTFQQEQLTDLNQLNEVKLQHLLLAVGLTGSRKLSKMNDDFLKERQKLFKPSGRVPEINQKLRQLEKIDEQIGIVEAQEATYQEKGRQMSEWAKKITDIEKEKLYQTELEKTILEQQKRFPMYIEWESLDKEFKNEPKATMDLIEKVQTEIRHYEFLLGKEKELLESQHTHLEMEAPAYQFYLENQPLFDELLEEQLMVESLSERRQLLEQQLKEYQESKATLFDKYHLSEKIVQVDLSEDAEKTLLKLAHEEEDLIRQKVILSNEKSRLSIRHKDVDLALTTAENQLTPTEAHGKESKQQSADPFMRKMFSGLSIAVAILFLILAITLDNKWIYVPFVLLVGMGIYGFLNADKVKKKDEPLSKESAKEDYLLQLTVADEVAHSMNELNTNLEKIEQKDKNLQAEKERFAIEYGFSMKETMSLWLSRIPIYMQLQGIEEKEAEMLKNLKEIDRVLNSYAESLSFAKQWIPIENKTTKESFKAVKDFVSEQQNYLQDKAVATNNQESFQSQLHHIRKELTKVKELLLSLIDTPSVTAIEDVKLWLKKQESVEKSQHKQDELSLSLESYFDLNKRYKLIDINHQLIRTKNKIDECNEQISDYQNRYQALKYEMTQMEKNGSLDMLYQEKENRLSKIKELSDQWMIYKLAEELTQDVFQYLSDQQLPALLATVTSYFKILTEENYIKVLVKEGQLVVLDQKHQSWPIIQLSTGTKDQLYMAFRLGFVHLHHEDYNAPVIIDDGWLHFDTKRKLVLFRLLKGFSQRTQVLCLSSDQAVKDYYETQDLATVKIGKDDSK